MMPSEVHQTEGARSAGLTSTIAGRPFCRLAGFQRFIGGLSRWPGSRGTSGSSTWVRAWAARGPGGNRCRVGRRVVRD